MKLKGINASSNRTITNIRNSFAELLAEKKEISLITVTELAQKADITRGAFYSHYDNIYQVADDIQEEILNQILGNETKIETKEDMNNYFNKLFNFLRENEDMYFKLLTSNETLIFMKRINNKICQALKEQVRNPLNIYFFTDGAMNLIMRYFRKETTADLIEIEKFIKNMAEEMIFN